MNFNLFKDFGIPAQKLLFRGSRLIENEVAMVSGSDLLFVSPQVVGTTEGLSHVSSRLAWRLMSALCLLALLSSCQTVSASAQDETGVIKVSNSLSRTWSSPDGRFKREGTLIEIMGDRVKLELEDGNSTVAQAAKLSQEDQDFIAAERARMANNGDSPFMVEESENSGSGNTSPFKAGKELDLILILNGVPKVTLYSETSVQLDANDWDLSPRKNVKRFRIPSYSIFADPTGFSCSPNETAFAVSLRDSFGVDLTGRKPEGRQRATRGRPYPGDTKSWVEIVDLATTKSKSRFPLLEEHEVLGDVNDQGNLIVTFGGVHSEALIRVFSVTEAGLQLEKSWNSPYGKRNHARAAGFLPDQKILLEFPDELMVLKLDPVEPLFRIPKFVFAKWAVSRDRTRLIVEKEDKRFLVDLNTGKCIGFLGQAITDLGVASPDNTRFAKFEDSVVTLRNGAGELLDEFHCPLFWLEPQLAWTDDRTICLQIPGRQFFVDVERRVMFLEVMNAMVTSTAKGGWLVEKFFNPGNSFIQVSQVKAATNSGPSLAEFHQNLPQEADSLLLFKTGDSVRLTTQLTADPAQEGAARQALTELLKKRGVAIDDNASAELRLSSGIRNEQVQYRMIGASVWNPGAIETVNVRMVDQAAELIVDGEVVWRMASTGGPGFMLQIRDGESAQQAADRQSSNNAAFWELIQFPKHVAKHPNGRAWNQVLQTPNGFQKVR